MRRIVSRFQLVILLLTASVATAQNVRITEFMASNSKTLADENREFSDWIEISNDGPGAVDLQNWALTDDRSRPFRWRFPATNLNAGSFLVVFASGKDRAVAGAELHTNFKLGSSGGYLALVRDDGTFMTEFNYPAQAPDVSYGFGLLTTNQTVIASNAPVRVRVPASGADGTNWTAVVFDDSAWISGINGVGYGSTNVTQADYSAAVLPTAPVGYWRFSESVGPTAANIGSGAGLDGTYTSAAVGTAGPRPPAYNGFEPNNNAPTFNGVNGYVTVPNSPVNNRGAFSIAGWIKATTAPGARVGLFGQNDCVEFGFISAGTVQCWTPNGGSVNASFNPALNTWYHIAAVGDGATIRVYTNGVLSATGGSATASYGSSAENFNIGGGGIYDNISVNGNWFNGQIDEVVAYQRALSAAEVQSLYRAGTTAVGASVVPFVNTDIGSTMSNVNASAYIRIPFTILEPTNVALLTLRLRYDDGAAAFINGVEAVRLNGPDPLDYNSASTAAHLPLSIDEFRIGPGMLQAGANVLAIQGLNVAADDSDFLIAAELQATIIQVASASAVYFTRATPGAANGGGTVILGPAILDSTHYPNVPQNSEDLFITAQIAQTFYPVTNVVMRYRVMFNPEIEVRMFDDGVHNDGVAGDGIYGATIPASASGSSEMVRWFFRATDDHGNTSRWPLFSDPTVTPEYLGTMVDYQVVSKLPVIHLFAPTTTLGPGPTTTQTGADSQTGGRVAVFYDGEFYDNVNMQLRGNSTSGYNKKSHRLEFNNEHAFRMPQGGRIRHTSFVADYPDPAYMRQGLSYWLGNLIGIPSPFYNPVRLQLNGQFYQLANHNDVPDQEQLVSLGYDPNGAFYNAAGQVRPTRESTGGFEKKTRRWDNDNDYTAMSTAINEATVGRFTNTMDYFEIPNAISYLVLGRWIHENDDVWANMSLYHDNDGDDLWRLIPFDLNLSWGAIFAEGSVDLYTGVQSTNDNHKAHPMYGSSVALSASSGNWNRVYDVFFQNPDTRQMFLRRMRTIMDTWIKPPGVHPLALPVENHVRELRDLIADEAVRDRAKWGWPPRGGQGNFDPGIDIFDGVNGLIDEFIGRRRTHFYVKHSITNASPGFPIGITKTNNAGIPLSQPTNATVSIVAVEYNPSSGNQNQEFLTVTNPNPYAIDISDWKLGGGVEFTFKPGTVIPSNKVVYVVRDYLGFRSRTLAPKRGMNLFVVGPYKGQLSARGEPLTITDPGGRLVYSNAYVGNPSAPQQYLRITEIMYHPSGSTTNDDDYEYIELKNISSSQTLNLAGVRFTEGISFDFTGSAVTSLAPGQRVLVVKNAAAFASRYPTAGNIAGQYTGNLDNSGDRLTLLDASNEEIHDFEYKDSWYPITDGAGFSLAIVDEAADTGLWSEKGNWRPSGQENGAPGQVDSAPPAIAGVLVNEILTHTDLPLSDTIELFNPTTQGVNVGGWFLSDTFVNPKKYRIPDGTVVPAGGYVTFNESHFNTGAPGSFALSSGGEEVYLFSADAAGNLTGYQHGYQFGAAENGVTFGRYTNSVGELHVVAQSARTLGAANAGPKVGPLIISEIMFHPPDKAGQDNSADEYIELQNITGADVPLYDPANPLNTWRIRGGVEYDFPPLNSIAANAFILVVNFNPADTKALNAFREKYDVDASIQVFGPYEGKLGNDADEIEFKKPDSPLPDEVPYVMVEQVDYKDADPWPTSADGSGASLRRNGTSSYANDPASWIAAAPTAGRAAAAGIAPNITAQPQDQTLLASSSATFSVFAEGSATLHYQWQFNDNNIEGATNSMLTLNNLQPRDAGNYSVRVFNDAGSATSASASLTVRFGAYIFAQPVSANKRPGESVTFSVSAYTETSLSYQWRLNGNPIPGANAAAYTINSVQLSHAGTYDVVLTDAAGTVVSAQAALLVLVDPLIIQPPLGQTVPRGGSATLSAAVTNTATLPMTFQWRVANRPVRTNVVNRTQDFFELTNVLASSNVAVGVINAARPGGILSATAVVTPLADNDVDGIPDAWEVTYGLNTNSVADATLDKDGDSVSNRDEYISGTDPSDAQSYLKVGDFIAGQGVSMSLNALSNRTYSIQVTESLGGPWSTLTGVIARSTNRVETVTDAMGTGSRFYRLVTPFK